MRYPEVAIGDVFEFIRNGKNIKQHAQAGGLPITRIETISKWAVDPNKVGFAGLKEIGNEKWILQKGDILFSHINSPDHIGKCAIFQGFPEKLIHGMNLLALRPKLSFIHPAYALHSLASPSFRNRLQPFINRAVNQASISTTNLKMLKIALPPIGEQRRVATILDKADALRLKQRHALNLLDALNRSIFLEMFGNPLDNKMMHKIKRLDHIALIKTGKTPPSKSEGMSGIDIPFATPADLGGEMLSTARSISHQGALHSTLTRAGSTLVSCIGTIGKMSQTPFDTSFNQQINAVEWHDRTADNFGLVLLSFYQPIMASMANSAVVPILNKSMFSSIEVIDPARPLKASFGMKFQHLKGVRKSISEALIHAESVFTSLQYRAFTGQL